MEQQLTFGSKDRYYAQSEPGSSRFSSSHLFAVEYELVDLVRKLNPDVERIVQRTVMRWNRKVREILRTETGLQLATRDKQRKVPIQVVPGLPQPLSRLLEQTSDFIQWNLVLHQALLSSTHDGLEYLLANLDDLTGLVEEKELSSDELGNINYFIKKLIHRAESFNLLHLILNVNEDVLGAYYFRSSVIHLHWLPIGLVASLMKVSVEALTTVVLAHELAHAYSHLGLDIDGRSWETNDFANSDLYIVEGLAQFYTMIVCENISESFPSAQIAFGKLLERQSEIYTVFRHWSENDVASGELIRHCLIRTRTQGIRDYAAYLQEVEQGNDLLMKKKTESTKGRSVQKGF